MSVLGGSELPGKEASFRQEGLPVSVLPKDMGGGRALLTWLPSLLRPASHLGLSALLLPSSEYTYQYSTLGCPKRCVEYIRIARREKSVFFCCNESYCNGLSVKDKGPFNPILLEKLEAS